MADLGSNRLRSWRCQLPAAVLVAALVLASSVSSGPSADIRRSGAHDAAAGIDDAEAGELDSTARARAGAIRFAPDLVLHTDGSAAAGLRPAGVRRLVADAARYTAGTRDHPGHPAYPGAVVLVVHDGVVGVDTAVGWAVRYGMVRGEPVELPPRRRVAMRTDTVFDIASLTKLFTTVVALGLVERGRVDLDAPVARYLPEFAAHHKGQITVRELLTHTAGLPERIRVERDRASMLAAVLGSPLGPGMTPGGQYQYSDLGFIALGALVERVTKQPLDRLVRDEVTGPLGMYDTGYRPSPAFRDRIAATEYQPGRGIIRGEVHDEVAAALGGIAGHAGIFSTAADLAVFGQMLMNGGVYHGVRVLGTETVREMLTNANSRFPGDDHGLGVELNQPWFMGGLASPTTFGHTGFTGTSIVVDLRSRTILVVLANQVHPDRNWSSNTAARNVARRTLATDLAAALSP